MAFYAPMLSIEFEYLLGTGALCRVAGETISYFIRFFAGFFDDRVALYGINLADKGEGGVRGRLVRCPD